MLILLFCCHSVCDFGIRMCSVRHMPKDFSANFGPKSLSLFGWWQGRRGVKANGDKRWQGGRGVKNQDFYGDILFEWPQTIFPIFEKLLYCTKITPKVVSHFAPVYILYFNVEISYIKLVVCTVVTYGKISAYKNNGAPIAFEIKNNARKSSALNFFKHLYLKI